MKRGIIYNKMLRLRKTQQWDKEPVFCFTSDTDWASEAVLSEFLTTINDYNIKPTLFVTNKSNIINKCFKEGVIERGIHPNFLKGSSHGDSFDEVIQACKNYAPEAVSCRSHRTFGVTDIYHKLINDYGIKYLSNTVTIMQPYIKPTLYESGLINFSIFWEDGTHLYNQLSLDLKDYYKWFDLPGLKVVSFHPMNFVFNSPSLKYMRSLKDSMTREEYNNINYMDIVWVKNEELGIGNFTIDIINYVKKKNYTILT